MEKMHVSSTNHAAQTAATAKNRAGQDVQGQMGAVTGGFSGLLAALGDNWLPSDNGSTPSETLLPQPASDTAHATAIHHFNTATPLDPLTSSLLALQAGFAGGQSTTAPPSNALPSTATVQLGTPQNPAASPIGAAIAQQQQLPLAATADTGISINTMPMLDGGPTLGVQSTALASSGGELGLVAQTAALDTAMESESAQSAATGKKIPGRNFSANALPTSESWAARTATNQRFEIPDRIASHAGPTPTLPTGMVSSQTPSGLGPQPLPTGLLATSIHDLSAASTTPLNTEALEGLLAAQGPNTGRGSEGRGSSAGQNPDPQGLYGLGGSVAEPSSLSDNPMFDMGAALPSEDSVAEQVSYWVNQNIQNAELTVEHDGHPVQVTVSLNGNEAHVSFASDQNETRALLDAGVAQLRELLESQGLVLSGMSVGEANTQGQNNNPHQQPGNNTAAGTRQTTVEANAPTQRSRSTDTISDQAVDVFV